ncbi:MAG: hypothetical protein EZS28_038653, partial [Streblomastix strix]
MVALVPFKKIKEGVFQILEYRTARQVLRDFSRKTCTNKNEQAKALYESVISYCPEIWSLRRFAEIFELSHTYLGLIINDKIKPEREEANSRKFTDQQERAMIKHALDKYNEEYPFTHVTFLEYIQLQFPDKTITIGYVNSFLIRRSGEITTKMASPLESCRFDVKIESA